MIHYIRDGVFFSFRDRLIITLSDYRKHNDAVDSDGVEFKRVHAYVSVRRRYCVGWR